MTAAQSALKQGLAVLRQALPTPFTVEGLTRTFRGLIEETVKSNELGEGGFIPSANGVLFVEFDEFSNANTSVVPYLGMRITVHGREFQVDDIGDNPTRWRLTLIIAHPRATTDVPQFIQTLEGVSATPLTTTNNPFSPS